MLREGKEKRRRALLQEEVRAAVEEERASRMLGMRQQGAWTRWEQAAERKVTWTELWKAEPQRIKFLKRGTLEHILSCCPRSLYEGRYRLRHDQVLKGKANTICSGIAHCKRLRPAKKTISFIRAEEGPPAVARVSSSGLLTMALDWELMANLGKQLNLYRPHRSARLATPTAAPWSLEDAVPCGDQGAAVGVASLADLCGLYRLATPTGSNIR
ncbi:unnamed protein product [Menidia menidia]|uniref:(Atlantic silverside) hypothetical protein n=1 Tax=Menidia menidia TaxID=238744 RepID=A0A8S4B8M5_9TELE|nr:unnamed protein product [Menidia menidia]